MLDNGAYKVFGQWVSVIDDFGKEIAVGISTTGFRIERADGQPLSLFWVGVFATASDCPGTQDWS